MLVVASSIEFVLSVIGVILGFVAIAVGVAGILLGWWGGKDQLRKAEEVHEELEETLDELQGEVATHYVGRFPDFMRDIVEVIDGADEQLTIFCDLPAYGVVSNPEWFTKYTEAVHAKVHDEKVAVRMLHLDKGPRMSGLARQFGTSWEVTRRSENVVSFVLSRGQRIESLDQQGFFDLIELEQEKALKGFIEAAGERKMIIDRTSSIMPMYFWIADRRAVFALTQFDPKAHEVGFSTRSDNMIKALYGIFDRYVDEARAGGPKTPSLPA